MSLSSDDRLRRCTSIQSHLHGCLRTWSMAAWSGKARGWIRPKPSNRSGWRFFSDAASQQICPLCCGHFFLRNGTDVEIYEGVFDGIELDVLNPASGLYDFLPDVIVLANCTQALRLQYYESRNQRFFGGGKADGLRGFGETIQNHSTARFIQFNYPLPYERQFGHYDLKVPHSLYATVGTLNARIAAALALERTNVLICDVESIASFIWPQALVRRPPSGT